VVRAVLGERTAWLPHTTQVVGREAIAARFRRRALFAGFSSIEVLDAALSLDKSGFLNLKWVAARKLRVRVALLR
jgi:hypothetical protein